MKLEEAKEVLMSLPEYQDLVSKECEAIDTAIHELVAMQNLLDEKREEIEHLQKENEKYNNKIILSDEEYRRVIDEAQKDCVLKDKIRIMIEAIEELLPKFTSGDVRNRLSAKKQILEELLKEE